jgi:glycosyltransferase involved in cell wall biosynthesis
MPLSFARHSNQSSRVSRYIMRARAGFSTTQREIGVFAALRTIFIDCVRSAGLRVARTAQRLHWFQDVFAVPALKDRFMHPGVLFIGYIEAGLGLGESLRGLVRSVATTSVPFALYPFNFGVERRFIGKFDSDHYDRQRRYRVNVIEMAADQVPTMFRQLGRWKTAYSYNILRTYWELPHAPAQWASMLAGIHEIWVPNHFVENAFRGIFDGPIVVVPPCVEVAMQAVLGREHFSMDQDTFYFMFSFDYFSYPARKNPLAVVRAFRRAFPRGTENVGLVLKSTGPAGFFPDIQSTILRAAEDDPRIRVVDRMFSRDEMLSLIRQSDCYISLHRSEGFGLGMAEAMALGKPVIGTDYSGNTDFLSELTGFPVPYTLRPVQQGEYVVFSDGESWAEPDEDAAVEALRRVFFDAPEREQRAAAGKNIIDTRYGRETVGRIAAARLRAVAATLSDCAGRSDQSGAQAVVNQPLAAGSRADPTSRSTLA